MLRLLSLIAVLVFGVSHISYADVLGTERDPGGGTRDITIYGFENGTSTYSGAKKLGATVLINPLGVQQGTPDDPIHTQGTGDTEGADANSFASVGCQGLTNGKAQVTAEKLTRCIAERDGRIIFMPYALTEDRLDGLITTPMTGTTSTAVTGMGAQGSGVRVYVVACTISNSHGTVGTDVDLQDGSGGSTIAIIPAAALYGGGHVVFPIPKRTTANTALHAKNITTGASVRLSCVGYKGP